MLERLGTMRFPQAWRPIILAMTQLPDATLRRFGGGIVVSVCVIYYIFCRHAKR
ncbi:DUF2065 domain-containing protein [Serratia symbiotica]|uniref:DUF2065 domain-containing protein n=1 Tax=Serratia symbiotica TaxID=138074 RepID=UPI0030D108D8